MKGELKRKSFEELMGSGYSEEEIERAENKMVMAQIIREVKAEKEPKEGDPMPDYPDIPDEEIPIRIKIFLRGCKQEDDNHRLLLNALTFELNKGFKEGCQAKELIEFYNLQMGAILDAFVF